ncbi:MAG: DUF2807 domain-containing protein [Tenacibaculum sp.]|nr:DUF2807 domain-containing protein [Tenacibaculum sp.]
MKKIIVITLLLMSGFVSSQSTINRELEDFHKLKVYNGINLELVKSDKQYIVLEGNKVDKAKIKERNGVLKIFLRFPEIIAKNEVKGTLYFNKDINIIDANEGAVITGKDLDQQKIEIKAQEGAFINLLLKTNFLKVKTTSGSVVKLSGSAKNQVVNATVAGVYKGYDMAVSNVSSVKVRSGAKAEINTGETLEANASLGGNIYYKGSPKILEKRKIIGGTIEKID